jgi:ubiquinol-cytochrome c reductase iron-sulfur subunit
VISRLKDLLAGLAVLLLRRRRHRSRPDEHEPEPEPERIVPDGPPDPPGELAVIALLLLGAALAITFVVVYALDRLPHQTQLLGLCLGLSLLSTAAALIVAGKRLVVTEELEDSYPPEEHPEEQTEIAQMVEESGSRITRRRLLALCTALSGGSLALALAAPAASLGPGIDMASFYRTPWRRGRRLVDENGRRIRADDIETDDFYTAFPEGADKENLASPLVLVRLPPSDLRLPPANAHYAAEGIVAYSKICTHAGCAISLYRTPMFDPTDPGPALVCPCHYSTFDPTTGGEVLAGPAGRKLPMLPLYIDRRGGLRAAGNFDGPVGASWWGVRLRKPSA